MLADAGRIAIEQNRRVAEVFLEYGIAIPAYSPLPESPPLCFMHIPKTGGASTIMWLESMFHVKDVAPCRNGVDFEILRGRAHSYRLFAGHFIGRQADLLPRNAQWITILRDPVEMAVSAYHHRRLAPKNDWEADRKQLPEGDPLRGDDWLDKLRAEEMTALFQQTDLLTALRRRYEGLRHFFRDSLARRMGATEQEDEQSDLLENDSVELGEMRQRQLQRAMQLLDSIDVVGEHASLNDFLLLVAASRGWPAPPTLARIHDFGAPTKSDSASPELREEFQVYSPSDLEVYERARALSENVRGRLEQLCGGVTAQHVDAHHRQRFFAESRRVFAFDISADEPWNGIGWGLRQRDGLRNSFRGFADGRSASVLVRLDPAISEYRLFVHVWDNSTQAVLDNLTVQVASVPLERVDVAWRHGSLIVEWRLPASLVVGTRGNIELVFIKEESTLQDTLSFARIGCVPAHSFE